MSWLPVTDTGAKRTDVLFDADGRTIFRATQNVAPVLDHNHDLRGLPGGGYTTPAKDMKRVASIPMIVIEEWMREGIDVFNPEHGDRVAKKLNDPEYAYLRTGPGRIGPVGDGTYR